MGPHRLSKGLELIAILSQLGEALGYVVRTEHPVGLEAIDIAWFATQHQRSPLFIFEVESRLGNAAIANPTKVFGTSNQLFEKPLFFFHVFLRGGQRSPKVRQLEALFGSHNYRLYRLERGEENELLRDILAQHARVTERLDIVALGRALDMHWWRERPDAIAAGLAAIAEYRFEERHGTLLPGLAKLALADDRYLEYFVQRLRGYMTENHDVSADYATYLGHFWHDPIHLAVLSAAYPEESSHYLSEFRKWQEEVSGGLTMIGPHFRLSHDYDEFVVGQSPGFLVFLAALMHTDAARIYIYGMLRAIRDALPQGRPLWLFATVWSLYLAAITEGLTSEFERDREVINGLGGVPVGILECPPAAIDPDDDSWITDVDEETRRPVPERDLFLATYLSPSQGEAGRYDLIRLALRALIEETVSLYWERDLLSALSMSRQWSPAGTDKFVSPS